MLLYFADQRVFVVVRGAYEKQKALRLINRDEEFLFAIPPDTTTNIGGFYNGGKTSELHRYRPATQAGYSDILLIVPECHQPPALCNV